MTKHIIEIADKFLLTSGIQKLPLSLEALEGTAKRHGWILETYTAAHGYITKHNLEDFTKDRDAFTFTINDQHLIFYNGDTSHQSKIHSICHEMGHIVLRHDLKRNIPIQEWEADVFAEEMISPTCSRARTDLQESLCRQLGIRPIKANLTIVLIICMIILSLLLIGSIMIQLPRNNRIDYTTSAASHNIAADQTVYITATGEKYHLAGCHYIADKDDLAEMTVAEAEQAGYEACKFCID